MRRLVVAIAGVGDGVDAVLAAARSTPGRARAALAVRRYRWIGIVAAAATLVLYLLAIGDIALGNRTARPPGAAPIEVLPDWTGQVFRARAPYLFESVAAVYPMPGLTFLLSPVDLILGSVLGCLVGLNLAVTADTAARASCRRGYGHVLAAVPALLTGMACCVPTFVLVAGGSVAAALVPAVLPLRAVFYPLSLVLLGITLVWGVARAS